MPKKLVSKAKQGSSVLLEAGIDEAGRGSWAGPVVAACVILSPTADTSLIADSKMLSAAQRQIAYDMLVKNCLYGVGSVDNHGIDELGIKRATERAMQIAVGSMQMKPGKLLVDGNDEFFFSIESECVIKGDQKILAIGAASIIAKVWRDRLMELYHQAYPRYHFDEHKGYGTQLHLESLQAYGPSPIHRYTFEPVEKVYLEKIEETIS